MIDFEPSEDQATLQKFSRALLESSCPPGLVRSVFASGADIDGPLWARGVEMGWTGLTAPDDVGGAGQGVAELVLVAEELGRAAAPGPITDTSLAADIAAQAPRTRDIAARFADGRSKAALARPQAITTRRVDDALVLSGRIDAVLGAGSVEWILIISTEPVPFAAFVPASHTQPVRRATLDQTRQWYSITLPEMTLAEEHIVSADRDQITRWLDIATVLATADSLGVGERILAMTSDHVAVREQFNRPLGSFQTVKHKLADMAIRLDGLRAAVSYAAMAIDADLPDAASATSVAKAFADESVPWIAGEALQCHGGIGFTWEHDLHLYLRRATVNAALNDDTASHHSRVLDAVMASTSEPVS